MEKTARERNFFRQTHHYFKIMPVKLQKVSRKSPRHDRKSDAGGETLKLVSVNFCKKCYFSDPKEMFLRILESICGVMQRNEAMAFRGRWWAMPGQRRSSNS